MTTNDSPPPLTQTEASGPVAGRCAVATGSPVWKVGDAARIATYDNCRWVEIIGLTDQIATVMSERGDIQYWERGSLETRESYLRSCERMRDEWTGAHYRKMVELADRPFVKPPKWAEWMARATGQENAAVSNAEPKS